MRKPEPLADPILRAIDRARGQGVHVARLRFSTHLLEAMIVEGESRLQRDDEGHYFVGIPVAVSRIIEGWVLETMAAPTAPLDTAPARRSRR